jgi:hypothetical protein
MEAEKFKRSSRVKNFRVSHELFLVALLTLGLGPQ